MKDKIISITATSDTNTWRYDDGSEGGIHSETVIFGLGESGTIYRLEKDLKWFKIETTFEEEDD